AAHAERLPVAARCGDRRGTVAAYDHLPRHRHRRALAGTRRAAWRTRAAAWPHPRPCPNDLGPAPLYDHARRDDWAQPGWRLAPPARAPRRGPGRHRPPRPRGPLPPDRAWIRAAVRPAWAARPIAGRCPLPTARAGP